MTVSPICVEPDYDAALKEIERYFEQVPGPGSPEADRFEVLATLIVAYEREHWPIEPPDPIEASSGKPKRRCMFVDCSTIAPATRFFPSVR